MLRWFGSSLAGAFSLGLVTGGGAPIWGWVVVSVCALYNWVGCAVLILDASRRTPGDGA